MQYKLRNGKFHFLLITFSISLAAQAQTREEAIRKKMTDSIKWVMLGEYAKIYPTLRQMNVSNILVMKRRFDTELNGNKVLSGKVLTNRVQGNFNLPLYSRNGSVVNAAFTYSNNYLDFTERRTALAPGGKAMADASLSPNTYGLTLSYSKSDTLFNRPVVYSLGVNGVTGKSDAIQKLSFMGTMMFSLKRTPVTSLSVGGIILIDPSLSVPFIPVVSYAHTFKSSGLQLLVDLPQRALLRKQFGKKSWATVGTEIASSVSFLDLAQYSLPEETNYSTFDLKNGFNFEHMITPRIVAGIGAGVFTTVSSRMFKARDRSNDYFLNDRNKMAPYLNVSVSFLPFLKPLIR